jgi:hypothetical protein
MAALLLKTARYRETSAQIPSIRVSRAAGHPSSKFNFPVFRSAATQTPPQGDRTILTILLPWPRTGSTAANAAGLEPGTLARAPTLQVWQPAPPRGRLRTAMSRRVRLGYTPLVWSLGGGHIADIVRQEW